MTREHLKRSDAPGPNYTLYSSDYAHRPARSENESFKSSQGASQTPSNDSSSEYQPSSQSQSLRDDDSWVAGNSGILVPEDNPEGGGSSPNSERPNSQEEEGRNPNSELENEENDGSDEIEETQESRTPAQKRRRMSDRAALTGEEEEGGGTVGAALYNEESQPAETQDNHSAGYEDKAEDYGTGNVPSSPKSEVLNSPNQMLEVTPPPDVDSFPEQNSYLPQQMIEVPQADEIDSLPEQDSYQPYQMIEGTAVEYVDSLPEADQSTEYQPYQMLEVIPPPEVDSLPEQDSYLPRQMVELQPVDYADSEPEAENGAYRPQQMLEGTPAEYVDSLPEHNMYHLEDWSGQSSSGRFEIIEEVGAMPESRGEREEGEDGIPHTVSEQPHPHELGSSGSNIAEQDNTDSYQEYERGDGAHGDDYPPPSEEGESQVTRERKSSGRPRQSAGAADGGGSALEAAAERRCSLRQRNDKNTDNASVTATGRRSSLRIAQAQKVAVRSASESSDPESTGAGATAKQAINRAAVVPQGDNVDLMSKLLSVGVVRAPNVGRGRHGGYFWERTKEFIGSRIEDIDDAVKKANVQLPLSNAEKNWEKTTGKKLNMTPSVVGHRENQKRFDEKLAKLGVRKVGNKNSKHYSAYVYVDGGEFAGNTVEEVEEKLSKNKGQKRR